MLGNQGWLSLWGQFAVEAIDTKRLAQADYVICALNAEDSKYWVDFCMRAGCKVVDHSSCFRQDLDVPLIVPEINGQLLKCYKGSLVSNPNCTISILLMALKPIMHHLSDLSVHVSTYQAVSWYGGEGS